MFFFLNTCDPFLNLGLFEGFMVCFVFLGKIKDSSISLESKVSRLYPIFFVGVYFVAGPSYDFELRFGCS